MSSHLRVRHVAGLALAALVGVLVLRPDGSPATAAEPPAFSSAAAAAPHTVSGILITRSLLGGSPTTSRWEFLLTAAGDQRVINRPRQPIGEDTAYRAATATETQRIHPPAKTQAVISTGLGPGPPDLGPDDRVLRRGEAQIVSALAAAGDPRVQPTTHAGRPRGAFAHECQSISSRARAAARIAWRSSPTGRPGFRCSRARRCAASSWWSGASRDCASTSPRRCRHLR